MKTFGQGQAFPLYRDRVFTGNKDEEFRWALGDSATMPLVGNMFAQWTPPGDDLNRKLMRDFRLYVLVGGMPQAVNAYLDTLDMSKVDQVKRNIIDLYDADFFELDPTGKTSRLFHAIPAQLNSNASRYQVGGVIASSRVERLTKPLSILRESMATNVSEHSNDPSAGLAMHVNPDCFKLYCGDTGRKLYYHTWPTERGNRNYEVDFLIPSQGKIERTFFTYQQRSLNVHSLLQGARSQRRSMTASV